MKKSKLFRVATEGATTDGRTISRAWIEQMARNFDPKKYGARVWIEHMRGLLPDSSFAAQGDVLSVQAKQEADGKLALYAQIQPLDSLIAINQKGQKLYTSIEVDPDFAGSGEAYMVGLAVTDTPASLGTEMLQFAAQHPNTSPLAGRKIKPGNLFTAAEHFSLELEQEAAAPTGSDAGAMQAMVGMFSKFLDKLSPQQPEKKPEPVQTHSATADQAPLVEAFAEASKVLKTMAQKQDEMAGQVAQLQTQHTDLVKKLSQQEQTGHQRPPATGGNGQAMADY
jgi:hypothetical protein